MTATEAPVRCGSCNGSGNGQTVITGSGNGQPEKCGSCGGSGRQ